jgi:hypothetical protein
MHSRSFTNPVFQAQYFNTLLPETEQDPGLVEEARTCIACHSPIAYLLLDGHITSRAQTFPSRENVTCDFCHTIRGHTGEEPGDGNYVSVPGPTKLGPFRCATAWHHQYQEFHRKSEFCAVCHNDHNRHGLEIKSTYTEWKKSRYADMGIQCQNCHMNEVGFLTGGRAIYEFGEAAEIPFGRVPFRRRLYTHRFPGAHSKTQLVGALALDIEILEPDASPGDEITINVFVDNSRAGHKMPSGSADLRLMWLELKAYAADWTMPVQVTSKFIAQNAYDVTGRGAFDQEALGEGIPRGNRIYRAIYVDETGKQTFFSYRATRIMFDNRLEAAEVRKETFRFTIPENAKSRMFVAATLKYLPYPEPFARSLGEQPAEAVEIATAVTGRMFE